MPLFHMLDEQVDEVLTLIDQEVDRLKARYPHHDLYDPRREVRIPEIERLNMLESARSVIRLYAVPPKEEVPAERSAEDCISEALDKVYHTLMKDGRNMPPKAREKVMQIFIQLLMLKLTGF